MAVEGEDVFGDGWRPDRVAVIAHWSPAARLSMSVRQLAAEFRTSDFDVVVVSSCEDPQPLRWPVGRPSRVLTLRKPNVGYDFGSWSAALAALPGIARAPHVVLANDSMAGPFAPLAPLLADFLASRCDVWGLTDTVEREPHLQSYFVGFRNQVLADRALRRFWANIRVERSKQDVIQRGEIGLSRLLRRRGYAARAAYPCHVFAPEGANPTIAHWDALLEAGFPFLKRELIRDPRVAPAGERAPGRIRAMFGEEVADWL